MQLRRLSALSFVLGLGVSTLLAESRQTMTSEAGPDASVTIVISGTLGPILAGSDPEGGNGKAGSITIVASESLKPIKHTTTSATYKLPAGAISTVINGTTYKSKSPADMTITIPKKGGETLFISSNVSVSGVTATITGTAAMAHGAFTSAALKHPVPFKSPQTLAPAKTANGPGSKVSYSAILIGKTVLGLTGKATD